jgi:hypothetical protein
MAATFSAEQVLMSRSIEAVPVMNAFFRFPTLPRRAKFSGVMAMVIGLSLVTCAAVEILPISGAWRFQMNGPRPGTTQGMLPALTFTDTIDLPGTTETRGKGLENTNRSIKTLTRLHRFDGPAWYERDVVIPRSWQGKRIVLFLERTKYTQVWLDGEARGENPILCTPQEYALGTLAPGRHRLTILVDNTRRPVKGEMHQMSDNTQGNWNGVIGRLELRATDSVWFDDVQVHPEVDSKSIHVSLSISNVAGRSGSGTVTLQVKGKGVSGGSRKMEVAWNASGAVAEVGLPLGAEAPLWDEFDPRLCELTVQLRADGIHDERKVAFGLRKFAAVGSQFAINGRTTFLRGKHDACVFPLTGHPPMDVQGWRDYFRVCQAYGINHVRFHTWTPPEAAFAAADELGIYLQPELPFWGTYDETVKRALMPEAERILKVFGNHPSFVMFSLGNECFGSRAVMASMIQTMRERDGHRRLFAQGSNNFYSDPTLAEGDDYWTSFRVRKEPGGPAFNVRGSYADADGANGHVQVGLAGTLHDYSQAIAGIPVPVIGHEVGQYTVSPDFRETAKYTGVMRPRNFDQFRERLAAAGLLDRSDDFFRASAKLAAVCYREEIEAAIRTPGFGGFQLLDLQDFPGQGTALVGMLDAFMDSKGAISAKEWRQFCGPIVLLARFSKYTWTAGETFSADLQVAHYGARDLGRGALSWKLVDEQNQTVASGELPHASLAQGGVRALGHLAIPMPEVVAAQPWSLNLRLTDSGIETSYPLWVFPARISTEIPPNVVLARSFDATTQRALAEARRVLLIPDNRRPLFETVEGGFATDFWNWSSFRNSPGTMGLVCDVKHPALRGFPTQFYSDWQWFDIATNSRPMILDKLPRDLRPMIAVADNYYRVHRLGLVFEAKVASGRLLVCGSDLLRLPGKPEARQLLSSLVRYAASEEFKPTTELTIDQLKGLFLAATAAKGTATASGQEPQKSPMLAMDGDDETGWSAGTNAVPVWWRVEWDKACDLAGMVIRWETDRPGYRYTIEGSSDGSAWNTLSDQRRNRLRGTHRINFEAHDIRAVRITIDGLPKDVHAAGIREVLFFRKE